MSAKIGGGGGSKQYESKRIPEYEDVAAGGLYNRAGIRKIENPEWTSWSQSQGQKGSGAPTGGGGRFQQQYNPSTGMMDVVGGGPQFGGGGKEPSRYTYDTSQVGQPVSKSTATQPYSKDLALMGKANSGFQNPYSFEGLPDQYGNKAFSSGSRSVRRQGADDLTKVGEMVGTRRPGLLLKGAQKSQRDIAEQLAKMRTDIDLNVMDRNLDTQYRQADENFRNRQALSEGAGRKVGLEQGITDSERAYQDKALEQLFNLYMGSASQMKGQKGGGWGVGVG